jgi:predicted double-glycine peptidase
MAVVFLLLAALLAGLGAWVGIWAAAKGRATGYALCIAGLAVIVVRGVVAHVPAVEERLYDISWYPYLALIPSTTAATAVLSFLGKVGPRRTLRSLLWVLCALLIVQEMYYSLQFVMAERWYGRLDGRVDSLGYCPQTSPYTCGAAAAAMLLRPAGIETDEQEMARLCLVRAGIGVTDLTLLRGIRHKLRDTGYAVEVLRNLDYQDLMALPKPCLVTIRQSWLLDHVVIVRTATPWRVLVSDPEPLVGRAAYAPALFERLWRGDALFLKPLRRAA